MPMESMELTNLHLRRSQKAALKARAKGTR
jgi:hypothetical protein